MASVGEKLLSEANRSLLGWLSALAAGAIVTISAAAVWAWRVENGVMAATQSLERIALELERRPTAAELNLQWRTLGRLNPDLELPPLLIEDSR